MNPDPIQLANEWLKDDPDEYTRAELANLIAANDLEALHDRFATHLEFGTAGLRGLLGAGPNRMNRAVVLRTTAGLCDHLQSVGLADRGVVIGFDGRRMSRTFAEDAALVCAARNIKVTIFPDLVPTPLLAFAVRALKAGAGIMITASHNPPNYNGYKLYWENGAQIIPPEDVLIANAIAQISRVNDIPRASRSGAMDQGLLTEATADLENSYLESVLALSRHPSVIRRNALRIVYTPLHGVGNRLARLALARAGFEDVHTVAEQADPDGAFPTVAFPNPEEKGALDLAVRLADTLCADLILANDPDADRLAVSTRDDGGAWRQLTGNEVGALLAYYLLVDGGDPTPNRLVITTVVSSPLLGQMARDLGVRYEEVLTGFKWIANRAMTLEAETESRFVFGYEEALGYTIGTAVRDKDGIAAACVFAELCAYYREQGRSLLDQLAAIYRRFGLFASRQKSVTFDGTAAAAEMGRVMERLRKHPPAQIGDFGVASVADLLPGANVLVFHLDEGSRITVRPSGTEPKVKYYFDVAEHIREQESITDAHLRAEGKIDGLLASFLALT